MESVNRSQKSHVADAASDLLEEGKKWTNEVREEGMKRACQAEESLKECTDTLLKKVQESPLSSVLIAAGVGFLLSRMLRK